MCLSSGPDPQVASVSNCPDFIPESGEGSFFHWWHFFLKKIKEFIDDQARRDGMNFENVQQDHRTAEQEATFIHQMVCWATIGPNIPGAVNTVIKLVNSSVRDTGFLASFTRCAFSMGFLSL